MNLFNVSASLFLEQRKAIVTEQKNAFVLATFILDADYSLFLLQMAFVATADSSATMTPSVNRMSE